jgi:uncharacterized protein YndB with AHSA1/START domain
MSQIEVKAQGTTNARPELVWSLVSNANRYPEWGPWNDGGYRPPAGGTSQVGQIQWFRYGRRTTSVERVLVVEGPRRLVYTVVSGLPVKNYRAEVTLSPTPTNGTVIRWTATWDKTLMGSFVRRKLQKVYLDVMTALVTAADHEDASGRSTGPRPIGAADVSRPVDPAHARSTTRTELP